MPPPTDAVAENENDALPRIAFGSVAVVPQLLPQLLSHPLNEVAIYSGPHSVPVCPLPVTL